MDIRYNKKTVIILAFISIISISLPFVAVNLISNSDPRTIDEPSVLDSVDPSAAGDFNILDFWESEIGRVNRTKLNLELGDNFTLKLKDPDTQLDVEFIASEVQFESPNWVGAFPDNISIRGYIIYPNNMQAKNPACLNMHGLGGNANASFGLAIPYLQKGFIVLCHSHPGHGESGGAIPAPSNWYYEGDYNKSAHYYLTLCAAIQGLRVLEGRTDVDNTSIMVTGGSYGAINTMYLSSICGERIAGAVPYVANGDLVKTLEDPTKLLFWIFGESAEELPAEFWTTQALRFDPIYYLNSTKLPPIMWQLGTTDEFFHHHSINGTFEEVTHGNKYLQIYPNGHHGFPNFENTTKFFIDYVLNGGPAPPNVTYTPKEKVYGLLGDTLDIWATVQSSVTVESVQVCYKYMDVFASLWQVMDLEGYLDGSWRGTINPGIITSRVEYYFIVNLQGDDNVWFSSIIYTPGVFISNFTIPFYIILVAAIAIPVAYLVRRRYKKNVAELDERIRAEAKKKILIEFILIGVTEFGFFFSLFLPWAVYENGTVVWDHMYIFERLMTWNLFFLDLGAILPYVFVIGWLFYSILSIMKPMLSGFFKIGYPTLVLLIIGVLTGVLSNPGGVRSEFGSAVAGLGIYLMLLCSLSIGLIGWWKRKYQTKLGIRTAKTKWYNIDRWLKIKNPRSSTPREKESEKLGGSEDQISK